MSRPPRRASAAASLGAVVLVCESIVVFLGGLVIYGLKALPAGIPDWWGIVGGAVVAILMVLTAGVLRRRWGMVTGWVLQVIVLASALLVPAMLFVALIFGGLWGYATIKGAGLDRTNAARAAENGESDGNRTDPGVGQA